MIAKNFLDKINAEYLKLHKNYEDYFWHSYMGDHSVDKKKDEALAKRDAFRGNKGYVEEVRKLMHGANTKTRVRLRAWLNFFKHYQAPPEALSLKDEIAQLESLILKKKAERVEGYIDPRSKKFVLASELKMRTMMRTHIDEKIRKACFEACENLTQSLLPEYCEMVTLRNRYARLLGFADFYDFKLRTEDGMTKKELFDLFDAIYSKTKYSFADIRKLEKIKPGLRKPWNFAYMLAGNFTKEEDPYFQFDDALLRWGKSFSAMGIGFRGGALTLDLLDRKKKWSNGFCHWPILVHYENRTRISGSSNFTCNVVAGQVGSGINGFRTLFHEGGHAAHMLTSEEREVFFNHEYPPMSMPWAETQSMFLEDVFLSIEWKVRYAKDREGNPYPFELFERKVHALRPLRPRSLNGIMSVAEFERVVYELKNPTPEKVRVIAKKVFRKFNDMAEDSLTLLNIPHIYSWESSASYHGYGLAELALTQWKEYFYKKYGYIVDNPKVGKEMASIWKLGGSKTFSEFVKIATGKKLSPKAFLSMAIQTPEQTITEVKKRMRRLEKVPMSHAPVRLNATIRMTHGTKVVSSNNKSFEDMATRYATWFREQRS